MLKKLIKNEFKMISKSYFLVVGLLAILTLAGFAYFKFDLERYFIANSLGLFIGIISYIFVLLAPIIFFAKNFYQTTATRTAYLTFSIPAEPKSILFAKLLAGFVWNLIIYVLFFVSIDLICSAAPGGYHFLSIMMKSMPNDMVFFFYSSIFLSLLLNIIQIATAIALSQFSKDHRIIVSIAFYFALYTLQQIVAFLSLIPFYGMLFTTNLTAVPGSAQLSLASSEVMPMGLIITTLVQTTLFIVGYFFLSNAMFKKKLNIY